MGKTSSTIRPYVALAMSTICTITTPSSQLPSNPKNFHRVVTQSASRIPLRPSNFESSHSCLQRRWRKAITLNQQETPAIDGLWVSLGDYRFEKDGQAFVLLSNEGADVMWLPMPCSSCHSMKLQP